MRQAAVGVATAWVGSVNRKCFTGCCLIVGRSIRIRLAKRGNSHGRSSMLTAGATLTPPIESIADAIHAAG